MLAHAMLDSADDFAAALFNLTHGFYKQALFSLRSALEVVTMACSCELLADHAKWDEWLGGGDLKFARECDNLQSSRLVKELDQTAFVAAGATLYASRDGVAKNSWAEVYIDV